VLPLLPAVVYVCARCSPHTRCSACPMQDDGDGSQHFSTLRCRTFKASTRSPRMIWSLMSAHSASSTALHNHGDQKAIDISATRNMPALCTTAKGRVSSRPTANTYYSSSQLHNDAVLTSLAGTAAMESLEETPRHVKCCQNCDATATPQWRKGPNGPNTLCNRCGLKYSKHGKMALTQDSAAHESSYITDQAMVFNRLTPCSSVPEPTITPQLVVHSTGSTGSPVSLPQTQSAAPCSPPVPNSNGVPASCIFSDSIRKSVRVAAKKAHSVVEAGIDHQGGSASLSKVPSLRVKAFKRGCDAVDVCSAAPAMNKVSVCPLSTMPRLADRLVARFILMPATACMHKLLCL
jgi:hypothetical protein